MSAQAPETWSLADQRMAVIAEIRRWQESLKCDVVVLQECEGPMAIAELECAYVFVGAAEAKATRGFVHVYVRPGVKFELVPVSVSHPFLIVRLEYSAGGAGKTERIVLVAVHMPSGGKAKKRQSLMSAAINEQG